MGHSELKTPDSKHYLMPMVLNGACRKNKHQDYADLSGHQVYACGAPMVVEAAHRDYTTQRKLPNEEFFSDAFTFMPKD